MLGEIVHNEDVLRDIEKTGIKRIRRLARPGGTGTLLVAAHGVPLKTMAKARSLGYRIVDATCPMVRQIHRTAVEMEAQGRRIIVIGDRDHDEVRGIVGQLKRRALVVDGPGGISRESLRGIERAAVIVQSTQDAGKVGRIVGMLRARVPDMIFHDTICRPTTEKQAEIVSLARRNDAMVIIGSRTSANTRRLYEISRRLNSRSHWIGSADELRPAWFRGVRSVGVGAGASTPEGTTRSVIMRLKSMGAINGSTR